MKTCTKCGEDKALELFPVRRRKGYKESLYSWCRDCNKEYQRGYRKNNPEKAKESSTKSRTKHLVKRLEGSRLFCKQHYVLNKSSYTAKAAKRRANRRYATPWWLTKKQLEEIENFYWLAKDLQSVTGEVYHVDHIVPIQGGFVCGLHVPWNLQILPADINLSKSNKTQEK